MIEYLLVILIIMAICIFCYSDKFSFFQNWNIDNMTNLISFKGTTSEKYLVLYYAPWCGACKRFMPHCKQISSHIDSNEKYKTKTNMIDCVSNKEVCKRDSINSYPTIRLITSDGKVIEYDGPRTNKHLTSFIMNN